MKRKVMLIPIILFIATMIIVSIATHNGFQDLDNILDDLNEAENESELKEVSNDLQEYEETDFTLGSQIGGLLNLINLFLVMGLFRSFKPGVASLAGISPRPEEIRPQPQISVLEQQQNIQPQFHPTDYSALNKKQLLIECKRRELKANRWTADQQTLREMLEENDK